MTRDEAVAMIKLQLGYRTTGDADIVTCLKLAQTTLEGAPVKPWFLVSEDAASTTTAGEPRLAVPEDFLEELEEAVLRYIPDTLTDGEVDLKKDDYDVLRKNFFDPATGTTETGPPEAYALVGEYFIIFPTPDDVYTIKQIYLQQDTVLDSNVENQWLKWVPKLIMGEAGKLISGGPLRDQMAFQIFSSWAAEGEALLHRQNISREQAGRNDQIGGPH